MCEDLLNCILKAGALYPIYSTCVIDQLEKTLVFSSLTVSIPAQNWHKNRRGPSPRLLLWQPFEGGAF